MRTRPPPVPVYTSPVEKPWCGPTAVKMVLEYHGIKVSIAEIAKKVNAGNGVWMPNLGSYLMSLGFKTNLHLWIYDFPSRFMDLPDSDVREQLFKWSQRTNIRRKVNRDFRLALYNYLQGGGNINPRVYEGFSVSKLRAAIKNHGPVIINVIAGPLWGEWERVRTVEHTIVLTKINSKKAIIHCPTHGKIELPTELLRFACYHAAYSGILFISKNENFGTNS